MAQQSSTNPDATPTGGNVSVATIIAALQALGLVVANEDFVLVPQTNTTTNSSAPAPPPTTPSVSATSSSPAVTCPHVCPTCQALELEEVEAASSSASTSTAAGGSSTVTNPVDVPASSNVGTRSCTGQGTPTANYRPAADIWYAVIVGREVGVVQGWGNVEALVNGVSGSRFRRGRSGTHQEAVELFEQALEDGAVKIRA
ncbi:hypothetical protein H0H93_001321 [Arthromyces matolae]|nr:hypothetical protein H0H93_001321 [Arthromyces matolae]